MSYSFRVVAVNKSEAKDKVFVELTKVCEQQPIHAVDTEAANATAKALIDLMSDDESQDISATVSGSIWKTEDGVQQLELHVSVVFVKSDP